MLGSPLTWTWYRNGVAWIAKARGAATTLKITESVCGVVLAVFTISMTYAGLKPEDSEAAEIKSQLLHWWWIYVPATTGVAATAELRRQIQSLRSSSVEQAREIELHAMIHASLTEMRSLMFTERELDQPENHHRATIFRLNAAQDRLEFYCRTCGSGNSERSWRYDSEDDAACIGIAAMSLHQGIGIPVPGRDQPDLPEIHPEASPSNAQFEEYAARTFLTLSIVRRERWRAMSYYAIPIKLPAGEKWGVVILDSTTASTFAKRTRTLQGVGCMAEAFGAMIHRHAVMGSTLDPSPINTQPS